MRNCNLTLGIILVSIIIIGAIISLFWLPYEPNHSDWLHQLEGPSKLHWLGTNNLGHDLLSQLLVGARGALYVGFIAVGIALILGSLLGGVSAFFTGILDELFLRIIDVLLAFPAILLALLLTSIYEPGRLTAMSAIGIAITPIFARLIRVSILAVKQEVFIEGAKALGAQKWHIFWRYILPSILSPIIVQASFSLAAAILAEAALSFLGLGTSPLIPSWGNMLREAQGYRELSPYGTLVPGIAIVITVLGWSLLGDGLRDILDPRASYEV